MRDQTKEKRPHTQKRKNVLVLRYAMLSWYKARTLSVPAVSESSVHPVSSKLRNGQIGQATAEFSHRTFASRLQQLHDLVYAA